MTQLYISSQLRSFFKVPFCSDLDTLNSMVAFVGVPFDQGTFGRPGARFGPDTIRDAPRSYVYLDVFGKQVEAEGFFDIDTNNELLSGITMADCGNIAILPSDVLQNFSKISNVVEKIV
ncbi:MAG: arginase family protein, partial [Nanoarchaeota archaeon]